MAQVDMTMEANLTQFQAVHSFVKPRSVSDSHSNMAEIRLRESRR